MENDNRYTDSAERTPQYEVERPNAGEMGVMDAINGAYGSFVEQITAIREAFVYATPNADETPETLR